MTIYMAALLLLREGIVKAQASRNPMLFHRVSVVNVVDGSIRKNAAVLVEGNTIKAVGEYDKLKTGVTKTNQVDCQGKYMIPGLWDTHVHL